MLTAALVPLVLLVTPGQAVMFEGDILISDETLAQSGSRLGAMLADPSKLWARGLVYYK